MIPVDRWEIFYGDGSTFTSDDGSWAEAPNFGIICVVYYQPNGHKLVHQEAHDVSVYEWWPECVPQPDSVAVVESETDRGPVAKMGLWVSNDQHFMVINAARQEVTP